MKTAVSIPDELFRAADAYAQRTKCSRSQLYADALAEYLARRVPDAVTEAMNRVADRIDTQPDAFGRAAVSRRLRETDW